MSFTLFEYSMSHFFLKKYFAKNEIRRIFEGVEYSTNLKKNPSNIRRILSIFFSFLNRRIFDNKGESGGKWTVQKWESGRSVESGRSWVKVDGLLTKSGRFRGKVDGPQKVDGPSESGRSFRKWMVRQKVDGP